MNPIKQLNEKRGSLISQADAILKPARDENRALTADEASAYDAITTEIDSVNASLDREIRQLALTGNQPQHQSRAEERDINRFSICRALAALVSGNPLDGIEAEMHAEGRKEARESGVSVQGNLCIPMLAMRAGERRDMSATLQTSNAGDGGGVGVATNIGSLIGLLYAKSVLKNLGVTFLTGLTGNIQFPRLTTGTTGYHVAETTPPTESNPLMDSVSLAPNRLGTYVEISKQLLLQSNPDVEALIRGDLATKINLAMEAGAIYGTGANNQPLGVIITGNGVDITTVAGGSSGLAPTWQNIIDLESVVATANADVGSLAYLTNPKVRGKLKGTIKAGSTTDFIWTESPTTPLNGYPCGVTSQVPSTLDKGGSTGVCSAIIFGNWSDMVLGMWGGIDIMANPYIKDIDGLVRINAAVFYDTVIRHGGSFAAMKDALTA